MKDKIKIAIDTMKFFKQKLYNVVYGEFVGNFDTAISSLEKQIPKKPKDHPLSDGKCPCCNAVFDYDWKPKSKFCQNCGQALDWSDTNDR